MLDRIGKIYLEKYLDLIIRQIKYLIISGELKSGKKLHPDRKLAQYIDADKSLLRDDISKFPYFSILKIQQLYHAFAVGKDVSVMRKTDFHSQVQSIALLEEQIAFEAPAQTTINNVPQIKKSMDTCKVKLYSAQKSIEDTYRYHNKIVEAFKTFVLQSLMLILTHDKTKNYNRLPVCNTPKINILQELKNILDNIINHNSISEVHAMELLVIDVYQFNNNYHTN